VLGAVVLMAGLTLLLTSQALAVPGLSPDSKKKAYSDGKNIFVKTLATNKRVQVTNNSHSASSSLLDSPWSRDGKRLAFVTTTTGAPRPSDGYKPSSNNIYVVDSNGRNPSKLTQNGANTQSRSATWSPDGERIAYLSHDMGDNVFVVGMDDKPPVKLTKRSVDDEYSLGYYFLTWSPDGSKLGFVEHRGEGRDGHVFVVAADGTGETEVSEGYAQGLKWSPDGTKLGFWTWDIYGLEHGSVVDVNSKKRITLTEGRQKVCTTPPQWSRDGKRLAYLTMYEPPGHNGDGETGEEIYFAEGQKRIKLVGRRSNVHITEPTWAPSGQRLVYTAQTGRGKKKRSDLFLVDTKTKKSINLTKNRAGTFSHSPTWSSDGKKVFYENKDKPANVYSRTVPSRPKSRAKSH
jgi:Tol biopolymer transport system component